MHVHERETSDVICSYTEMSFHLVLLKSVVKSYLFIATYNTTSNHVIEISIESRYSLIETAQ